MSELIQKQVIVPDEYHQYRIDVALAQLLPEYSRSQLSAWIKAGAVTINQQVCKPKDKVLKNSTIDLRVHFTALDANFTSCQPEAIDLDVVYEDDEVLLINKPKNLVVHPGAGNKEHTLVNALLHHEPQLHHLPRAGIVHRLDKDTTGLLIVAKTLSAHTALIRQMQAREIERHYLALVQGQVIASGTIDTYFGRHPRNRLKMAVTQQGKQAITHYTIKKRYAFFTLLDVYLMTGRTHQIRVHMAHINYPIVGDPLYNNKKSTFSKLSESLKNVLHQFNRQALHAYSLSFSHPKKQEQLTFTAPIPDDLALLLATMDQDDDDN